MKILKYTCYKCIKNILSKLLISLFDDDDAVEYYGIRILGIKNSEGESFRECVRMALLLLKEERPVEYKILKRNVSHIIFEPGTPKHAVKFMHSCCNIPWNNWNCYEQSVRSQIMAASLIHEAYRGECLKRYGYSAFLNNGFEAKYRKRAIRILRSFQKDGDQPNSELLEKRINELKERLGSHIISCGKFNQ